MTRRRKHATICSPFRPEYICNFSRSIKYTLNDWSLPPTWTTCAQNGFTSNIRKYVIEYTFLLCLDMLCTCVGLLSAFAGSDDNTLASSETWAANSRICISKCRRRKLTAAHLSRLMSLRYERAAWANACAEFGAKPLVFMGRAINDAGRCLARICACGAEIVYQSGYQRRCVWYE